MKFRWVLVALVIVAVDLLVGYWFYRQWRANRYDRHIHAAARRYELPAALIKAVVWKESAFNAAARGTSGEYGLMQIREMAAQEWADSENLGEVKSETLLNPATNTLAGSFYLAKLLKRYVHTDNPLPYALADYNAGRSNVLKWIHGAGLTNSAAFVQQIGFPSTKLYVEQVMKQYEQYRSKGHPK